MAVDKRKITAPYGRLYFVIVSYLVIAEIISAPKKARIDGV